MRKLLAVVLLLVALWGGYWLAGKIFIERAAEAALADLRARGAVAQVDDLYLRGFPNRFDLTLENPNFADPQSGYGWQAPFAQVFAMTWKPWHLIAALPNEQSFTLPDQKVSLTGTSILASARVAPESRLPFAEARLSGEALQAHSDLGWQAGIDRLMLALRQGDQPQRYDLGLNLDGITPDPRLGAALQALRLPAALSTDLPAQIDRIHADASVDLSAPLDRFLAQSRPEPQKITLRDLSLTWGALILTAKGELAPDAQGLAEGKIELQVTGWDRLPALLVAAGVIKAETAPTINTMLASIARQAGPDGRLTMPLVFANGWMNFGPFPLGPAPRIGKF